MGGLLIHMGGRSTSAAGRIGIKDVKPGNRPIVTEGDASDEITSLKGQWRVGGGEVAGAHGLSVSVALVGPSQPHDEHSHAANFTFTPRPDDGYGRSPLLDPSRPSRAVLNRGYNQVMGLVYGTRPAFDDCIAGIGAGAALL